MTTTSSPDHDTPPRGVLYAVSFYVRALLVLIWFLFSSGVGIVIAALKPGDPSNPGRFSHLNSWLALRILGLKVEVSDTERMLGARPCVFVTNHQANEDVFIHGSFYPPRTVVTGKRELIRIPMFGWMFKATGNILLDRGKHTVAVQQLGEAAERVRNEGVSIWLFPEGHRNKSDRLLPFKRGGFHLAVLAQVPIVPVVTQRYGQILDFAGRRMYSGTVHIEILEPIPTAGMTDADIGPLAARVQEMMEQTLAKMGPCRPGR